MSRTYSIVNTLTGEIFWVGQGSSLSAIYLYCDPDNTRSNTCPLTAFLVRSMNQPIVFMDSEVIASKVCPENGFFEVEPIFCDQLITGFQPTKDELSEWPECFQRKDGAWMCIHSPNPEALLG